MVYSTICYVRPDEFHRAFFIFPPQIRAQKCYRCHKSYRFRIRFWSPKSPFCSNFYGPYSSFVSLCMTRLSSKCRLSSKIAIVHMHSKKQTGDTFSNAGFRLSSELKPGSPKPIRRFSHNQDMCHQFFKECTCIQRTHPVTHFRRFTRAHSRAFRSEEIPEKDSLQACFFAYSGVCLENETSPTRFTPITGALLQWLRNP